MPPLSQIGNLASCLTVQYMIYAMPTVTSMVGHLTDLKNGELPDQITLEHKTNLLSLQNLKL